MQGSIVYVLTFIVIVVFLLLVKTLKGSMIYNEENERYFISVLDTVGFIIEEFNVDDGNVVKLVEICYIALDIVNETKGLESLYDKKEKIELFALDLIKKNNIDLGDEFIVEVVDRVADYIIAKEMNRTYESVLNE